MQMIFRQLSAAVLVAFMVLPLHAQGVSGARQSCDGGTAAGFACSNVDLISWMARSELAVDLSAELDAQGNIIFELNDMWGWTHEETGRSFLIVGRTNASVFVEVTDPFNPVFLGELPSSEVDSQGKPRHSVWRDMKVYGDHAYIVADGAPGHGMQVFDLTQLLTVTDPQVFGLTNHYTLLSSVHNIVINEDTGFAYAVGMGGGAEPCGSGLHMIDLSDPANPQFAGCYAEFGTSRGGGGYTHDAHCVVYQGPDQDWQGAEICVNANEQSVVVTDVSNKQAPLTISVGQYPATEYTHQGWLSEDHRYYFQGDELDEARGSVGNTRTLVWDMQDLDDPVVATEFLAPRNTIDHNMYVRGDLLFQSQYVDGLRILDISDPLAPAEVGFFDTHPANRSVWDGSWSNYPFMDDNMVAITSSVDGLFIVQPNESIIENAEPPFNFAETQFEAVGAEVTSSGSVRLYWTLDRYEGLERFEVIQIDADGWESLVYAFSPEAEADVIEVTLAPGEGVFRYRIVAIGANGQQIESEEVSVNALSGTHLLGTPWPNPSQSVTRSSVAVSRDQHVVATVHDALGRVRMRVFEGMVSLDRVQEISVDASLLPPGTYYLRVMGEYFSEASPFVVVR